MKKTILQTLIDEVHYPLSRGFVENKCLERGLSPDDPITAEVVRSRAYRGAVADCLLSLVYAPNFSESDKSVSLADKELILARAKALYRSIGEDAPLGTATPTVAFIG